MGKKIKSMEYDSWITPIYGPFTVQEYTETVRRFIYFWRQVHTASRSFGYVEKAVIEKTGRGAYKNKLFRTRYPELVDSLQFIKSLEELREWVEHEDQGC